uniref:Uncharacterized protein n=1 Tax=Zea mays TaxID=4577 RepID=A0A804LEG1_MAIZE
MGFWPSDPNLWLRLNVACRSGRMWRGSFDSDRSDVSGISPQPRAAGEIRTSLSVILAEGEKVAPADSLAAVAAWVLLPWRLASEDGDRSTSHRGSDSHGFCSSEEKCPKVAIVFQ